ncbi:UDP-glycosyltransferase UGT5-like [Teleopsis dalmanni]|uniref:UDP-glycosyltransferase UGT5-like n=1 Tax=Teleopsis dalmanni TaxID=139649 RepID=UPI0018CE5AA4|nr:UDP-glycosyltransferase UGT5-like [Teleopsis dalmanni]
MFNRSLLVSFVFILVQFVSLPNETNSANILGFFPGPSKSHFLIHSSIADALGRAGHNVTVLSVVPNVNKNGKYNFIHINSSTYTDDFATEMINNPQPAYKLMSHMLSNIMEMANETMGHPTMQEFLKNHKKSSFDLIIYGYFMNEFHFGLSAHFDCPTVVSFMIQPMLFLNDLVGNPEQISYVPTMLSSLKQPLTFLGRVQNFLASMLENSLMMPLLNYENNKYYRTYFPADQYPSLDEVKKNISLVFTNHHFSQGPIRPNVPAMVEIGGIQIKEKPDPLPVDIKQHLDSATNGAIFFSLGSTVKSSHVPKEKTKMWFNVLSKLPYKILWKWEEADAPGFSENIVYRSWLPQDDILAHPNVKLFITHAGQGSVVESQFHGVPMVCIPLFGDQPANALNVIREGYGVSLDYINLNAEDFKNAIVEVLDNPKYTNTIKQFSVLYRDRPMSARQVAVFWVEYILRHKGAKHMQSPAVFLNNWQLLSLDVIGFLLTVLFVVILIFVELCKLICCRSKGKSAGKSIKTKKNN